jgi:hypothetical protein
VVPGQYVFADSSGAVVIPGGQIEEVLAEARKVEAADAASRDQIAREQVRVNDHSASSPRACSTRGAPFAWLRHSRPEGVPRLLPRGNRQEDVRGPLPRARILSPETRGSNPGSTFRRTAESFEGGAPPVLRVAFIAP